MQAGAGCDLTAAFQTLRERQPLEARSEETGDESIAGARRVHWIDRRGGELSDGVSVAGEAAVFTARDHGEPDAGGDQRARLFRRFVARAVRRRESDREPGDAEIA